MGELGSLLGQALIYTVLVGALFAPLEWLLPEREEQASLSVKGRRVDLLFASVGVVLVELLVFVFVGGLLSVVAQGPVLELGLGRSPASGSGCSCSSSSATSTIAWPTPFRRCGACTRSTTAPRPSTGSRPFASIRSRSC